VRPDQELLGATMPTYDDAYSNDVFDGEKFRQAVAKLLTDDQILHSPDTRYLADYVEFDLGQYYRHAAKIALYLIERDSSTDIQYELPDRPGEKIPLRYILVNHFLTLLTIYLAKPPEIQKSLNLSFLRYVKLKRPFPKNPNPAQDLYVGDVDD
jgi:hypothetical protein